MSKIEVNVNGRAYQISCDEGQESRVEQLAGTIDRLVGRLTREFGQIGDARLLLLAALTIADELSEARRRIASYDDGTTPLDPGTFGGARRVIDAASQRIAEMAARL
ncbi:MAG: cell division protein ZapA [Parvularculaceae bacterium]|nr:cell division protein ZapA [Parvularculaceae bacterium]